MAVVYLPRQSLDQEQVAALAYQLWENRDRQDGTATEDWLEAERMLRAGDDREVTGQAA